MIFVSVGTFVKGFDELVLAMDEVCEVGGYEAFAQIGGSIVIPKHMEYARFLSSDEMSQRMQRAELIVCHGGFGILGDAMRAGKPIISVPRDNPVNSPGAPANNQILVVERLSEMYGIHGCFDLNKLGKVVEFVLSKSSEVKPYELKCNVPNLIANFLKGDAGAKLI